MNNFLSCVIFCTKNGPVPAETGIEHVMLKMLKCFMGGCIPFFFFFQLQKRGINDKGMGGICIRRDVT